MGLYSDNCAATDWLTSCLSADSTGVSITDTLVIIIYPNNFLLND